MEKFEVGDVVFLRSGSAAMTIESIVRKNYANVVWYEYDFHKFKREQLALGLLKK